MTGILSVRSIFTNDASGYSRGRLTGTVMTVFGCTDKIHTAYYYDIRGRLTRKVQSNLLGGYDVTTTTYGFTDKPLTVTHEHTASGKASRTEVYTYSYDGKDRLIKIMHKLGSTTITLAEYTYDDLDRLATRKLHGNSTNTLTYSYNIRSWLTGISSTKFTQTLGYGSHYNGNISSMNWTANGTSHAYTFTYDDVNRMLNATHGTGAYTEKVTAYDKNGNIKALQRYGNGLIDDLTYTYSGNQLTKVEDATGNTNGFSNGASAANEYVYDNNGNLTKDSNKGITSIAYNCLNLPSTVTFSDGSTIVYSYAADGTKLRTVHTISGTTTQKDYCANVVYENGVQKMLLTEEGYVDLSASTPTYYYYLKDHQGNNRVVINSSGTVAETNHYYPFGSLFASTSVQPYKYNGKELDTKKGLNWYDYGARHYDAALGRWLVVDPLAEKYYSTSVYGYCLNNPVKYIDPDGRKIVVGSWFGRLLAFLGVDNFESKVQRDIAQLKKDDSSVAAMIKRLDKSRFTIEIVPISNYRKIKGETGNKISPNNPRNVTVPQGSKIEYDPENTLTNEGRNRTPRVGLTHELGHADDLIQGKAVQYSDSKAKKGNMKEQEKGIKNERHAIEMENIISKVLNEPTRKPEDYYKKLNESLGIK